MTLVFALFEAIVTLRRKLLHWSRLTPKKVRSNFLKWAAYTILFFMSAVLLVVAGDWLIRAAIDFFEPHVATQLPFTIEEARGVSVMVS
jgi:hypothetical protein